MLIAGIELAAKKHQLQLFEHQRKCLVKAQCIVVTESTVKPGPVSEKMQPVPLLYQTGTKTRCNRAFKSPLRADGTLRLATGF
ncbi:hypothetical protein NS389_21175 [Pantoea dispersa]|nr:hypothetical protein NS389_21175 [Pantoea dispersa]KTS52687.1 hypothetical protein NS380_20015 [Pantoea dispersa]